MTFIDRNGLVPPRLVKVIAAVSAAVTVGLVAFVAFNSYGNWSAEEDARAFCAALPAGSGISSAIAKAKDEKVIWIELSDRFHRFLFRGSFFDNAICDVEVDRQGKVLRKVSEMQYD